MFTVKQLARIAGITPRTLHYYDEIGLLKPSRLGENAYRYYGDDALLRLQQILLYRELGMALERIRAILDQPEFDVLRALESHKEELRRRITHLERLSQTVDDTILHLKGEKTMSQQQLFEPFSEEQQAAYEEEAMRLYDPEIVKASNRKWKGYSAAEKERIMMEGKAIYQDIIAAMPQGAAAPAVQACIERWRQHMAYFWAPNEDQLLGLARGYNDDPRFKANFDQMHPSLAAFMLEAVEVYVRTLRKSGG